MKVKVYNQDGKENNEIEINDSIFGLKYNPDLVAQVIKIQEANRRSGIANTKDRSEVSGTNQKPWRQKGTGRARHGSNKSPLWRHGGITHGPSNLKNYKKVLPKGIRNAALFNILSQKLKDNQIIFVDDIKLNDPKTKEASQIIDNLSTVSNFENLNFKKKNNVYLTFPKLAENEKRAFRNLSYILAHNLEDINPLDLAKVRYMIITNPVETIKYLESKLN